MSSLSSYAIMSQYGRAVVFDTKDATQDYPFMYVLMSKWLNAWCLKEIKTNSCLTWQTNRYIQLSADSLEKSGCDVEHVQVNADL